LENEDLHPRDVKKRLAREIVQLYHSKNDAFRAEEEFEKVFKNKLNPEEIKEIVLKRDDLREGKFGLQKLLLYRV
jgi:Tyrosyl-tRNA synthetase